MSTFGRWLQQARGNRKAVALAEEAGISPQMWSDLENDRSRRRDGIPTRPTLETCKKLARVLDIPVSEVLAAAGYPVNGVPDEFTDKHQPHPDDDPILLAIEAFYKGSPPELHPRMLGEVTRIVREHQREQTTHGKRADVEAEIRRLEEVKAAAEQEIARQTAEMRAQIERLREDETVEQTG